VREAAGRGRDVFEARTVEDLLSQASERYPAAFATVLLRCRVWVNGEEARLEQRITTSDEVALIPPVSGG
jgi:molybdopterin converting factor small subunit